ncbi:MAG TPA: hypothetical protein VFB74_03300 [Kribbellaceae bacterium]|jgi:hypothetical protein|nr:hypothetical protein [Kribbellaceae bacterium]
MVACREPEIFQQTGRIEEVDRPNDALTPEIPIPPVNIGPEADRSDAESAQP